MNKSIAIIAALDTKGAEATFVAEIIKARGYYPLMIDVGVLSDPQQRADVSSREVALAAGAELQKLRDAGDKFAAISAMTNGAAAIAAKLYAQGRFQAIVGLGGSAGTAIASSAMRALPVGVPKVLVSTVAAGDTRPYIGDKDLTLMYSVVDIAGLNRISQRVLANAAGAAVGMAETRLPPQANRPLIAASMFGNTTACVDHARALLETAGYEVLVFHSTGVGGRTMEGLIADGYFDGVLDLTTTEWADEICGGVFSAGPTRLDAAAGSGIPQVIAPGCLDMANYFAPGTVPERFAQRKFYRWNANVTLMRTDVEENARLGGIIAEKINRSVAPATVLLPLGGVSQLDSEGGEFWWPEANQALFSALRDKLRPDIKVIEVGANINAPIFAERAVQALLDNLKATRPLA